VQEDSLLYKASQDKNQNKRRENTNSHTLIKKTFHSNQDVFYI